jgi:hypothetical protein
MHPPTDDHVNMADFIKETEHLSVRDLTLADFDSIDPIGSGNGGVVWKVKHRMSGLLLARKVRKKCSTHAVLQVH